MTNNSDKKKKHEDIHASDYIQKLRSKIFNKLQDILSRFNRLNLLDISYTCIKELIINASKANMKRAFFAETNLDINNFKDWLKGSVLFKEKLDEKNLKIYTKKIKNLNYKIDTRFVFNKKGLRVEVINNTPIPKIDEVRMRKELAAAMKYNSISDYYMDHVDNIEGAGMGLALIIILLTNQGIDPQYLRIGSNGDNTIARLEIPFTKDYIPYRKRKYKEKLEKEKKDIEISQPFATEEFASTEI